MVPADQPPRPPDRTHRDSGLDEAPDLDVVFQMTRDALDLQFKVAERIDSKARGYFGFTIAVFSVAQALALRSDVRAALGPWQPYFEALALGSALLLLGSVAAAVWALLPQREADAPEEKLRELLKQSHFGRPEAGTEAVNFLIGELVRRRATNRKRNARLTVLIWLVSLSAGCAVAEIALAVAVLV